MSVDPQRFLPPGSNWAGYWDDPPRRLPEDPSTDALRVVEKATGELEPSLRAVIVLRDIQGWTAAQVCAVLAIAETEQRQLLHRARSAVRHALERHHDGT